MHITFFKNGVSYTKYLVCVLVSLLVTLQSKAQSRLINHTSEEVSSTILKLDSIFWQAYNTCNLEQMNALFSPDMEFYHDKGGLTTSADSLMETIKKGICLKRDYRLRREEVKGSLKVYPLQNYGAILTGEHLFYLTEKGKPERTDGIAKFTHVWQYKNNEWKMTRVLSYDHQPAPMANSNGSIKLSPDALKVYVGKYEGTHNKNISITQQDKSLHLEAGGLKTILEPVTEHIFALKERNLQFEFVRINNKIEKLIVRENSNVVEEAKKVAP